MKPLSRAYHDLAGAYATGLSEELRNVTFRYRDVFVRDTNLGLVKQVGSIYFMVIAYLHSPLTLTALFTKYIVCLQVAASLIKKNIQRLTKTFLTLSFIDVANKVQLSGAGEAEKYILDMIKSGEIFATINQKDGMVVFKDDPEKYNSPEMFLNIQNNIKQIMELNKQVVRMEEEIKLNPQVIQRKFTRITTIFRG